MIILVRRAVPLFGLTLLLAMEALGQEATKQPAAAAPDPQMAQRFEKLEQLLTGSKLTGNFTIVGKPQDSLPQEEYTILSAKKSDQEDWWVINARIKYQDKDVTLPIPLRIKWADDTPVISMTNLLIPGLGTFSCRVVIYDNKYAGTWSHGEVGGHLFGVVQRAEEAKDAGETNDEGPRSND